MAFFFTDERRRTVTMLNSKAKRTAAVTVCQQNLHCCSLLVSITLSCLSSSPWSCRLRSEYSDGLSHSKQQAKLEWCAQKTWSKRTNFSTQRWWWKSRLCHVMFLIRTGAANWKHSQGVMDEALKDLLLQPYFALHCLLHLAGFKQQSVTFSY